MHAILLKNISNELRNVMSIFKFIFKLQFVLESKLVKMETRYAYSHNLKMYNSILLDDF